MRQFIILIIALSLTACSMDVEEYNTRVKYCNDKGMDIVIEYWKSSNEVHSVYCQNKQGNIFKSKTGE